MNEREVSRLYRVWFFAEGERFLSFWRCHRTRKRAALGLWCGWFKPLLEIRHAAALTTGAKHWHRQKAVFYVFVSVPHSIYPLNPIERSLVTVARYGVEPRRGSVMMMKKIFTSRPTLSEAHIVYTLLSPSCVSLHTKTLAWCFASFGISDAYPNCYISFP